LGVIKFSNNFTTNLLRLFATLGPPIFLTNYSIKFEFSSKMNKLLHLLNL